MKTPDLRNRANHKDRPWRAGLCRTVPLVKADSTERHRCKEGQGHDHIFLPFDRYGCCTRCGDEVLV